MKMSRGLLFFLLCVTFIGCSTKQAEVGVIHNSKLDCAPSELKMGEQIRLSMKVPHGGDLAVKAPDGSFTALVFRKAPKAAHSTLLMTADEFETLEELVIDTKTLSGFRQGENAADSEKVFISPGAYQFILTTQLYSDAWPEMSTCEVVLK